MATASELWMCPECGHRFVTANMWHSCSNYSLEHHFEKSDPEVRATFDAFLAAIEAHGEITVIPQKTRIAIQADVRFAGCVVRRRWLLANLWMTRRIEHPRLRRTEAYGPRSFGHQFRLDAPEDVDDELRGFISEAYRVGLREHLESAARSRGP